MAARPDQGAPGAGKRERNKAENREAIVAAATQVFADLGYEGATVRDVIGATHLAAGTFYNYFRDKESVFRAVLEEKIALLHQRTLQAREGTTTPEGIVRATLHEAFAFLHQEPQALDLLRRNGSAIRALFHDSSFAEFGDHLERDLAKALRSTGIGSSADATYLTAAIVGITFEVAATAAEQEPADLQAAADFAVSFALSGLAGLAAAVRSGAEAKAPRTPKSTASRTGARRPTAARKAAPSKATTR